MTEAAERQRAADGVRKISLEQFKAEAKAQEVDRIDITVICPLCDTPQSMRALIAAGAGAPEIDVEKFIGYSCVGRLTGAGSGFSNDHPKGRGCNYTLGGLFKLPKLIVILPDGAEHPHFEIASKEQAHALRQALDASCAGDFACANPSPAHPGESRDPENPGAPG